MAEKLYSDFSGGMNALVAVDKLDPKECLLAQNVRLDETGNIQSAGAMTAQNTSAYAAAAGTNTNYIHSLFWNPSFGGVAGVGQDVFQGQTLGTMTSALAGKNAALQKMSFASAPNRVYFDVGSAGYWTDETNLLLVDWAPPSAASAVTTGPDTGTFTATVTGGTGTATGFGFSLSAGTMQGLQFTVVATITGPTSGTHTGKLVASLVVGGVVQGTSSFSQQYSYAAGTSTRTFTFGGANYLFGNPTLTPTQVNASNFGILFANQTLYGPALVGMALNLPKCTAYQQAPGFVFSTGAAGVLTGTYTWKVTFVAANGEESDGSVASTSVVLASQQGTGTGIPTGDARTTSRNVYRKGNTLTSYYLVGSIPDNVSTTFSDNMTDSLALSGGTILAGDVPGDYPNSRLGNLSIRFPVYHYDRVFWVNQNQTNQIVWSKPLNGFAYPVINFFNVGDSKPISRIVSIFGELIIIKTDSIWRLTGTDETSFNLSQTPSAVGTDQSFTVVALPDKILYANRWGLWVFNGYTSVPLTTKLDLWFKQKDQSAKAIGNIFTPPEVASSTIPLNFDACGNSEKYYLAYAQAGQVPANATNNRTLVFDVKHGNITQRNSGFIPLSLAIDPVTGFVYVGDQNGVVSLLDDWNGATQEGAAAPFDYQHGYQDVQRGSNKALWALEFYLNTNGQSLTPIVYYDNGAANETLTGISTTSLQRVVRTMESTNARKCQNWSFRLNGMVNPVNVTGTPQIQVVHVKALYDLRVGRARTGQ